MVRIQKRVNYVNPRGINLYYETYGNGGSIDNFIHQIPYFSQRYQVVVADSRSQGKTADTGDSLSYEMMADDLAALLTSLHLDSCYVIGWSDGASTACCWRCATRRR